MESCRGNTVERTFRHRSRGGRRHAMKANGLCLSAILILIATLAPVRTLGHLLREFERGHLQVAGLFRSSAAYLPDGRTNSVFGWGVNNSLGLNTIGRDNLILAGCIRKGNSKCSSHPVQCEVQFREGGPEPEITPTPRRGAMVQSSVRSIGSTTDRHLRSGGVEPISRTTSGTRSP
jgi:hypothetical protein